MSELGALESWPRHNGDPFIDVQLNEAEMNRPMRNAWLKIESWIGFSRLTGFLERFEFPNLRVLSFSSELYRLTSPKRASRFVSAIRTGPR